MLLFNIISIKYSFQEPVTNKYNIDMVYFQEPMTFPIFFFGDWNTPLYSSLSTFLGHFIRGETDTKRDWQQVEAETKAKLRRKLEARMAE